MRRLAQIAVPLLALSGLATPAFAADLDGPVYRERDVVIERPAPPVVRERIIERHYYAEPTYPADSYAPTYYYYAPRAYDGYAYDDGARWYPRRVFFARPYWHHHHRPWGY